jgi:hypothetical protein
MIAFSFGLTRNPIVINSASFSLPWSFDTGFCVVPCGGPNL